MPAKNPVLIREIHERYYSNNTEKCKRRVRDRKRLIEQEIRDLKESLPCVDCGNFYPYYVMQFDHVGGDKVANVSQLLHRGHGRKSVMAEIAKCELVCANCHAKRTWQRQVAA